MAYRDISRGVSLAADHAKYITWLNKDTAARQAAFATVNNPADRVKINREAGYLVPFGSEGSLVYLPGRLISASNTGRGAPTASALRLVVAAYTFTDAEVKALSNANILDGVKYVPAKLTFVQRVTTATAKESSRITGRNYYRHENDSVTTGFGKRILADTYSSAVTAIKATAGYGAFTTGAENAYNKIRFVPEKF